MRTTKTPKIMNFIQSWNCDGTKDVEQVYVYGPTNRRDEGMPGHDMRCRPVRLGAGAYTFVCAPDSLEEIEG